ncbi:multicopper oxidase domain-containing protein [Limnochorda pilosa]|uniref:Ferroxidase n=1 Tax=Limnochorda pilosa TaxID=1555112 RepID=A0A0K2SHZ5_LIMPI|nr:multicopper oxidase domain-containing protein [Limnochorda pilosa]BAS26723.1 ferroxidase [Limnochorda pilosa]
MPATVIKHIWAKAGTIAMPGAGGPVSIPVWGYAMDSCPSMIPGPTLDVTAGDTLQVVLHNTLAEPVSMIFPGQPLVPRSEEDAGDRWVSFTAHAEPQDSVAYAFQAARPGTYRYESGTHPERQVQMGLAGVLIVRPAGLDPVDPATWTAYGTGTGSEYDVERVLVLGEVDSRLHHAVASGLPHDPLDYAPDGWMINGRAFPDTLAPDNDSSQPLGARVTATTGQRVLLRCVNTAFYPHALHFGGLSVRVVAEDGYPLRTPALDATYEKHTLTLAPGQTCDVILTARAPGEYYIFDRDLYHATNEGEFPGGMMTRLEVVPRGDLLGSRHA